MTALTFKPFKQLEKKMQIDPASKEEIHARNHANGVSQVPVKQSSVDEWLAMGAMLVEEMRAKRAALVAELAQIDSALRKLSPEAKALKATAGAAETPITTTRPRRKEGGKSQADLVVAVVPKLRAEAITSTKAGELSGLGALAAQKTLSALFAAGRVHRARDINLLHGFLYWDAR